MLETTRFPSVIFHSSGLPPLILSSGGNSPDLLMYVTGLRSVQRAAVAVVAAAAAAAGWRNAEGKHRRRFHTSSSGRA